MNFNISDRAKRQIKKLPPTIRKKIFKSFSLLQTNYRHPSLRSKKMSGFSYFEARIDYQYRFIFEVIEETINIVAVGPHDTGLGKK